jgi:hypothetical protein
MDVGRGTSTVFWDLSELRQVCGYEMSGIIGMPSLENCIVQIDFDKGRLTLLKRIKPHEDWGESVPIIPDRYGIPRVFISVPGEEFPFVVDTGSYTTCITAEVLRSLRRKNAIVAVGDNRHRTLTGDRTTTTYKLSNLSLARFEHKDLLVDEGRQCRIGLQYLSRFCVTFDFPDGQMYLKKGSRYESRDQPDLCGLSLHPNQPRLVVEFVSPDSAAEHAGIQAGDEIIRIDGKESSAFSRFEIRQLFRSEEGRTIRVEISRSGETVCSELTLKPTPFTDTREPGR